MNQDSKESLWLLDHLNKCRCCFETFNHNEKQVKITEIIEEQFLELTKIKLQTSTNYSNNVCKKCVSELQSIFNFRSNLITKQQQLYEFVLTSQYKIQDVIKIEQVSLKTEAQSSDEFDNSFLFESMYGDADNPEVPAVSKTTKTDFNHKTTQKKVGKKVPKKVQNKKDEIKRTCSECSKVFQRFGNLSKHIRRIHLNIKQYFCDLCKYSSLFKNEMEAHMKNHFTKVLVPIQVEKKPKKQNLTKRMCPHCGRFFGESGSLSKHVRRVHLKLKNLSCDLCSYSALFKNEIQQHMQTHLPDMFRQKFHCVQCKYETVSDERMKRHVKNDHGAEPKKQIQCVCHCGKVFQSLERLNSHKKYTHLNEKNHICTICGKAFQSPSRLKNHMAYHTGKLDVGCDVCGKMFVTLKQLKVHSIYHTEPEFRCNFAGCTKKYYINSLLVSHMKTHIDQRDFACKLCDKKYFLSSHLQRHILHFHKQLKVSCELPGCSSKFARKETYRNHVLSNHKDLSENKIRMLLNKIREMKQE